MSRPKLSDLRAQVETADLDRRSEMVALLAQLRDLRDFARGRGAHDVASCMEAAGLVMEVLAGPGERLDREALRAIVVQLLGAVRPVKRKTEAREPEVSAPPSPPAAAPAPAPRPTMTSEEVPASPPPATPLVDPTSAAESTAALDLSGLGGGTSAPPVSDEPLASPPGVQEPEPSAECAPASSPALETTANESGATTKAGGKGENGKRLGQMLIELGHITEEQLEAALEMQAGKGIRIGECLLLTGATTPDRLLATLALQEKLGSAAAASDGDEVVDIPQGLPTAPMARPAGGESSAPHTAPDGGGWKPIKKAAMHVTRDMFLGEVLLGAEMITNGDLERAMHMHHLKGVRVGEALVEIGALTQDELACGLELHQRLRNITGLRKQFAE